MTSPAAASLTTIDSEDFQQVVEVYYHSKPGVESEEAYRGLVAYIDQHFAKQRAAQQTITLNGRQLRQAADLANPDGEADPDQLETVVVLSRQEPFVATTEDGQSIPCEAGIYLHYEDMPEEGLHFLKPEESPTVEQNDMSLAEALKGMPSIEGFEKYFDLCDDTPDTQETAPAQPRSLRPEEAREIFLAVLHSSTEQREQFLQLCESHVRKHGSGTGASHAELRVARAVTLRFIMANGLPEERNGKYRYPGIQDTAWQDTPSAALEAAMAEQLAARYDFN